MSHNSISPFGEDYAFYRGIGNSPSGRAVLTPQAIPNKKKNQKWKKTTMDNLEAEGLRQYVDNLPMKDWYSMLSGDKAYIDLLDSEKTELSSYIDDFKSEKLNLPSYLAHYDLLFPIVSKIVGDWAMQYDRLRFDTTDETSTNDYIRERTLRLNQYAEALYRKELDKMMLMSGIDVKQNFNSEEEYNQYQASIDQIIKDYFPDKIDQDMKKNFKTEAAQWAQKTWDRDSERFRMNILEAMEARDVLLTGKSARHYRVGYDYYYPEYWHPIEVFHSKDVSVTRFEDCEYVGRVAFYSISKLMETYGDVLTENQRNAIYKAYFGEDYRDYSDSGTYGTTTILGENYYNRIVTPFQGYSDHKLALEFEDATGIPLSQYTDTRTGETKTSFSVPLHDNVFGYGANLSRHLRTDLEVRTDTVQVTEAYWKGSKKIGQLTYRTRSGYLTTVSVDEDLLTEVKEQYGIKNLKKVSLAEFKNLPDDEKENTVIWIDAPIGYRGIKIRVSGVGLQDDIYIVDELPYQIRGEKGNMFHIKLPVCGQIGDSYCKKIRPYQIAYNYFLNQNTSYLQREIGAFFVIDVNSLPIDFFGLEEGEDALYEIRNLAKTTGLLPTDFSRNNLNQAGGLNFNPMSYQNATFTEPLQRNLAMADRYKWMAYETLGLTPATMGAPTKYTTTDGIQMGQQAYFAQTYTIEQTLMENKRANVEVHMSVAQYCQLNNKDANYLFMASNNELEFLQSIKDENFALRKIDVRSTYDAKKHSNFQTLKGEMLRNNTMGNDAVAMTEIFLSNDFMSLREAAVRARNFQMEQAQAQREHESKMMEAQLAQKEKENQDKLDIQKYKVDASVKVAELNSLGRNSSSSNDVQSQEIIQETSQNFLRNKEIDSKNQIEYQKLQNQASLAAGNLNQKAQQLNLERERIQLERDKLNTMRDVASKKNFDSIVNKN